MSIGMHFFARSRTVRRLSIGAVALAVVLAGYSPALVPAASAATVAPSVSDTGAGILRAKPTKVINGDVILTGNESLTDSVVHGQVFVRGTNNLVENNVITGRTGSAYTATAFLVDTQLATNATVRYNTIKASVTSAYVNGIGLRNVTVERNDISQVIDGIDVAPATSGGALNTVIRSNYIHDLMFFGNDPNQSVTKTPSGYSGPWANTKWSHDDAIQIMGGSGLQITGNTINAKWSTVVGTLPTPTILKQLSAVMINHPRGNVTGLVVSGNWIDYGEASINGLGGAGSGSITGNRFGRHARAYPMWIARAFSASASGNVYADTGASVSIVWS